MNVKQTRNDAVLLVDDYLKYGIDYINEISERGPEPLNKAVISLAASYLQADTTFADWAFVKLMH